MLDAYHCVGHMFRPQDPATALNDHIHVGDNSEYH